MSTDNSELLRGNWNITVDIIYHVLSRGPGGKRAVSPEEDKRSRRVLHPR